MPDPAILAARDSFTVDIGGGLVTVSQGDTAHAGHPVVTGREELWEPLRVRFAVEAPAEAVVTVAVSDGDAAMATAEAKPAAKRK